jgi:hypothetical protein
LLNGRFRLRVQQKSRDVPSLITRLGVVDWASVVGFDRGALAETGSVGLASFTRRAPRRLEAHGRPAARGAVEKLPNYRSCASTA